MKKSDLKNMFSAGIDGQNSNAFAKILNSLAVNSVKDTSIRVWTLIDVLQELSNVWETEIDRIVGITD
jgi:hypothetical protein